MCYHEHGDAAMVIGGYWVLFCASGLNNKKEPNYRFGVTYAEAVPSEGDAEDEENEEEGMLLTKRSRQLD